MKKEYISPDMGIVEILAEMPILVASINEPQMEDFDVSDGEW